MNDLRDPVVDVGHAIINPPQPFVYSMRRHQIFRNGHPPFLLQLLQPLQRIFDVSLSDQPLPIFFWTLFSYGRHTHTKLLTDSALLHVLGRNPENRENFDHYLNDRVHHFRGRPHLCVDLQASEKNFQ
jgi:hypothetical protein